MPTEIQRRLRELWGLMASGGFTALLFAGGPLCALLWWVSGAGQIVELVVLAPDDHAPVQMSWAELPSVNGEEQGEGGEDDVDSGEDGEVDVSGDEGADEVTSVAAVDAVPTKSARTVSSDVRTAKGRLAAAAGTGKEAPVRRRREGRNVCPENHPDVVEAGEERWEVNRNLVEYYTANIKRFNSLGWSGPYEKEDVKGWKVSGFGCTSPLFHAGLRRGDVVLTVNGKKTRNWLQVFGLYTKLKLQKEFEVVVVRRGQQKTLKYSLVKGGPPHVG